MHIARLDRIEPITPLTWRFFFSVEGMVDFFFTPGQFVTLDLPIGEKPKDRWRSYSIASAPAGTATFELVIVRVEGGRGTRYLFDKAQPGTRIPFMGPLGKFVLPDPLDREVCFICTGTGIAPFRSMLQYLRNTGETKPPMHLIFGTRHPEDILYRSEMEQLAIDIPSFSYHIALSRAALPGVYHGYVHGIYETLYAEGRSADFYLCGWKNMIDEARKRLTGLGYSSSHIHLEIYG